MWVAVKCQAVIIPKISYAGASVGSPLPQFDFQAVRVTIWWSLYLLQVLLMIAVTRARNVTLLLADIQSVTDHGTTDARHAY